MKTCSILISNYNSENAIELCVESVNRYTDYPHTVTVIDAGSTNGKDLAYLRKARRDGLVNYLIESPGRLSHGASLNVLMDSCQSDLAMILDCDIEITASGWLAEMVGAVRQNTLAVLNTEINRSVKQPSLPSWFQSWFMLWNMRAYRGNVEDDWRTGRVIFNGRNVFCPTGGRIWMRQRAMADRYVFTPLPMTVRKKFRHVGHVSVLGDLTDANSKELHLARAKKLEKLAERLRLFRGEDNARGQ